MYVGLECYGNDTSNNGPLFGLAAASSNNDNNSIVRRYPLGSFLSGMRGLDIGVETCVSVNARGMMAIQHQVSREGYYDYSDTSGDGSARPSFVDFIMVAIEEEEEEEEAISQDASVEMQNRHINGLHDITNDGSNGGREAGRRKPRETAAARNAD